MCRYNHGTGVDYFAVGVIAYEFMIGKVLSVHNERYVEAVSRKDEEGHQGTDDREAGHDQEK